MSVSRSRHALPPHGNTNPASPITNERFYRDDLDLEIFYDGTRWLTTELFRTEFGVHKNESASPAEQMGATPWTAIGLDMYIEKIMATMIVVTTNDGSNFWTFQAYYKTAPNSDTTLGSSFNSSAVAPTTYFTSSVTVNAVLNSGAKHLFYRVTKTASPGNFYCTAAITYRLVVT